MTIQWYKSRFGRARSAGGRTGPIIVERNETLFFKITTVVSLVSTAALALLALGFSRDYNERELRRDNEKENYQRRREAVASIRSCLEFDIALARERDVENNQPLRIALARSIDFHVTQCHQIGYEIDRRQALALLNRVGQQTTPIVEREVNEARSSIRSVRPVTDRQRAEAFELLGFEAAAGAASSDAGNLVNIVAYGGGAILQGTGLLGFKRYIENPTQSELRKAIGPGAIGDELPEFPTMNGLVQGED